jgi:hypothetical protein
MKIVQIITLVKKLFLRNPHNLLITVELMSFAYKYSSKSAYKPMIFIRFKARLFPHAQ